MSFIIPTERRHWRTRLLYVGIYAVVTVGALTMVYPFLIMLAGSVKCRVDFDQFEIIPRYLFDDAQLYRKFTRARYNANAWRYQIAARSDVELFEEVPYPERFNEAAARDLSEFVETRSMPAGFLAAGQFWESGVQPRIQRQWRAFLVRRTGGDLRRLNREFNLTSKSWDEVLVPEPEMITQGARWGETAYDRLYRDEFRPGLPRHELWPVHCEGLYFVELRRRFGMDIRKLNERFGTDFATFQEITLSRTYPPGSPLASEWEFFVRRLVNPLFLRIVREGHDAYREFLRQRYGAIEEFNRRHQTDFLSFEQAPVPARCEEAGSCEPDWLAFVREGDIRGAVVIDSFDTRYRDYLKRKYETLSALNAAHGERYGSFETVPLRLAEYDAWILREHRTELRWEFFTRNYRQAFSFLALRGRALWVTFLYCTLNVLLHMTVNPLAAYALSRYQLRSGHWILLFCVLTMAFPAEVGSIPRFLLIRELGLLNSLWALLLPGAAHGFAIFILKGFFDGLPRDLYESAVIEGAPERWIFWNVTLALTKPILAVTAFSAFTAAYGAFLFALIICPAERMWTISVWLYQFQQQVSEPVGFAGLVLSSIPMLLAFLLVQRFILRGIVLPVEK